MISNAGRALHEPQQAYSASEPGVLFAPDALAAVQAGVDQLADLVRPTLGPTPRNVAVAHSSPGRAPEVLDDAATIVRRVIQVRGPFVDMGAMLLRHALFQVAERVGDGTATTAVLLQAIMHGAARYLHAGGDVVALRRGLERGGAAAVAALGDMARPLAGSAAITRCAQGLCQNEQLARLLGESMDVVGPDGFVQVDAGHARGFELQYIEGVYWYGGLVSPYFITDAARQEARLIEPAILVSDLALTSAEQLTPLLDRAVASGVKALLVIAREVSGDALGLLVANHRAGTLRSAAVVAPLHGDQQAAILEDLAVMTGGRAVLQTTGARAQNIALDDLGRARVAWATQRAFGLRGGGGDTSALRRRIQQVKANITRVSDVSVRETMRARLGKLRGGIAVLRVGGATQGEIEASKVSAERTIRALRSALSSGVVPGGTRALLLCRAAVEAVPSTGDEQVGLRVLAAALAEPFKVIVRNAGYEPAPVLANLCACAPDYGFDARSGNVVDLWSAGIVDPCAVLQSALETAVSGAVMALTTDVLVHRRNPRAMVKP